MNVAGDSFDERQRLWLKFAWVRWLLGVVAAVLVSLLIVSVTVSDNQYNGCLRSAQERLNTAKKDAQDAVRERRLAVDPDVPDSIRQQHADSSDAAAAAAINIASLAGYNAQGDTIQQQLDDLRTMNLGAPRVGKANKDFCHAQYKPPLPFVK